MKKNYFKIAALTIVVNLFFVGCATTVPITVEQPPNLPTAGITRVAVMPFEAPVAESLAHSRSPRDVAMGAFHREMATRATNSARAQIGAMSQFTLVDPSRIAGVDSRELSSYVDAILTGNIGQITTDTERRSQTNREGRTTVTYRTTGNVELNFQLTRASDGSIIGHPITRNRPISHSSSSRPSDSQVQAFARTAVDAAIGGLSREMTAHRVTQRRTFATDQSRDRVVRDEMRAARDLLRAGNHVAAHQAYLRIYEQHGSVAAAENAAILYESFGDMQAAADLLQRVVRETGNPRAQVAHERVSRNIRTQERASEHRETRGRRETVASFAIEEIQRVLPENAMVWIHNRAQDNAYADFFADYITDDFLRNRINIVDRQHIDLILSEQELHASGLVRNDQIGNIGNMAGANTIVIIDVTGRGGLRRLFVQVLDIESGETLMRSDTSEQWSL